MRALFIAVRILGAALIVAAIVGQLITTYNNWDANGIPEKWALFVNFFSFFTIDSNVLTVVVFVIGAVVLIRNQDDSPRFAILRASVTSYMVVTGIVYNLLLRGIELPQGTTLPWSNEVLHVIGPVLIALDWLYAPGRRRLEWKHIGIIVIFPLVWAIYTMIRGPLATDYFNSVATWYPYPFLNPALSDNGYLSVAFYVVLIAVIIGAVGAAVIWVSRRRHRWPLNPIEEPATKQAASTTPTPTTPPSTTEPSA